VHTRFWLQLPCFSLPWVARGTLAVPWLADTELLWPGFEASWPSTGPVGAELLAGVHPDASSIAEGTKFAVVDPWHLPLYNTLLLLASSVTLTIAHHALRANKRAQLIIWLAITVILGRCIKGHFTPERHFAFEAGAWYWHFVDTVWVGLFIFVYIL